jgi:hypothetical protein
MLCACLFVHEQFFCFLFPVANMRNHVSIEPVAQLLDAYEKNNIRNVERILRENAKEITDDAFLSQFIQRLLTKV